MKHGFALLRPALESGLDQLKGQEQVRQQAWLQEEQDD